MRGELEDQGHMFSYISLEERVPPGHPLRKIRKPVREVFAALDGDGDNFHGQKRRNGKTPPRRVFQQTAIPC